MHMYTCTCTCTVHVHASDFKKTPPLSLSLQVVSLAHILMDPYYRTLKGFRALIEKEWLALGHPFTDRACHVNKNTNASVSPVFLQFLDCVHQVCG